MAGATSAELIAAVSEAGGLGVLGASFLPPQEIAALVARARELTSKPLGINVLVYAMDDHIDEVLALEPRRLSTAWPRDDQDIAPLFARAHERGCRVMHMVPHVVDAVGAAEGGADVSVARGGAGRDGIVAEGSEGGGHIGEIAGSVLVRQVVKAVAPVPVLAAGGFVDGAGLGGAPGARAVRLRRPRGTGGRTRSRRRRPAAGHALPRNRRGARPAGLQGRDRGERRQRHVGDDARRLA